MSSKKAVVIYSGVESQIVDADILLSGVGIDASTGATFTIGAANATLIGITPPVQFAAAIQLPSNTAHAIDCFGGALNIASGAGTQAATLNLAGTGTPAGLATINLGTGAAATINIGNAGSTTNFAGTVTGISASQISSPVGANAGNVAFSQGMAGTVVNNAGSPASALASATAALPTTLRNVVGLASATVLAGAAVALIQVGNATTVTAAWDTGAFPAAADIGSNVYVSVTTTGKLTTTAPTTAGQAVLKVGVLVDAAGTVAVGGFTRTDL